jgi:hypothetical protein
MIIVMKKIILIPLLLSTILLVGCETETEFDRCIEANGGNAEFDLAQYMKKGESEEAKAIMDSIPFGSIPNEELPKYFKSLYTPAELEFYKCALKKFKELEKEFTDSGLELSDVYSNIDMDEIFESCLPKNRAKAICHSQGIY